MHIRRSFVTPYNVVRFEGSVYWDELAEICGEILRVAGFRGVARFRGNTVYQHLMKEGHYGLSAFPLVYLDFLLRLNLFERVPTYILYCRKFPLSNKP